MPARSPSVKSASSSSRPVPLTSPSCRPRVPPGLESLLRYPPLGAKPRENQAFLPFVLGSSGKHLIARRGSRRDDMGWCARAGSERGFSGDR